MLVYLSMIFFVAFVAFLYTRSKNVVSSNYIGSVSMQYSRRRCYLNPAFILVLVALLVPYVIRYDVGTDFSAYYFFYEWHTSFSIDRIKNMRDSGYYLLERWDYNISNGNWYFHNTIVGLLTYIPVVYVFMRFSNDYVYTILIYIFSMGYYGGYNAVRQTIAISLIMIAVTFYIEHKRILSIVFVFIAYTFHSSVIIVIFLLFICMTNFKNKITNIIKVVMMFSVIVLPSLWNRIMNLLSNLGQDKMVNDYSDVDLSGTKGANLLRIGVYIVPVIFVLIMGTKIIQYLEDHPEYDGVTIRYVNFMINAVQFAGIFMLASLRYWIFARIASYFVAFTPLLYSYIYPSLKKEYQFLFKVASLILFFAYMCFLLPAESNLLPFKTEWGWNFN